MKINKNNSSAKILIVEDEAEFQKQLKKNLIFKGFEVDTAGNVDEAIKLLNVKSIDVVITDMNMPNSKGSDLVRHIRENLKDTGVIVMTGFPSIEGAVEVVKTGAEEYLIKPFKFDQLLLVLSKVLEKLETKKYIAANDGESELNRSNLIGESEKMMDVMSIIKKAAITTATVLITGESGTGKELVAQAIHSNSSRSKGPFVPVNCGAIPDELLESELFGCLKGAFTGSIETRPGFFQAAEGGTIFLDEISNTSLSMQAKLLRILQNKEFYMVGSRIPKTVDVRILAASNKNLLNMVRMNRFREDLFFRLNVININLPPLRERDSDVLLLVQYFLKKYSKEYGIKEKKITDSAFDILKKYYWPGNVRELENVVQNLIIMTSENTVDMPDLPSFMRFSAINESGLSLPSYCFGNLIDLDKIIQKILAMGEEKVINIPDLVPGLKDFSKDLKKGVYRTLSEIEKEHINNVLGFVENNKSKAAEILGINRKTLREKIKKYDI